MILQLENISKSYKEHQVLDDISLTFQPGEIVGLVGVNGVGKSTLLKIIAGLIPNYKGQIHANGQVGYLSERNPLYPEMYVIEYLRWIRKLSAAHASPWDINDLMQQVGISNVAPQKIKTLSKGYRQRVGLAATIIDNPPILLLDEPINGLDPVQITEYHQLIKSLKKDRIIILSSHLLQEIEALCDRVLKLENGKISTDQYLSNTDNGLQQLRVIFDSGIIDIASLQSLESIDSAIQKSKDQFLLSVLDDQKSRVEIFDLAVARGTRILEMAQETTVVNQLF